MGFLFGILGVFFLSLAAAEQPTDPCRAIIHSSLSSEVFRATFCSKPNFQGSCISLNDRISSIQIPDFNWEIASLTHESDLIDDKSNLTNDSDLKQKVILQFIGLLVTFGVAAILSQI